MGHSSGALCEGEYTSQLLQSIFLSDYVLSIHNPVLLSCDIYTWIDVIYIFFLKGVSCDWFP